MDVEDIWEKVVDGVANLDLVASSIFLATESNLM